MTKPSPWAIGTTQTSLFFPQTWNYCSALSIWLKCMFKTFHGTKKSNTQEISSNEAYYLAFEVRKQNFITQENIEYVCQCLHRHVMMWLCSHVLCVNPFEATPSIPHLSLYLSPAIGGLTLWNACCHLSSITTCCCPILPGLYCLGFILDKSRKALRFMGLGWV